MWRHLDSFRPNLFIQVVLILCHFQVLACICFSEVWIAVQTFVGTNLWRNGYYQRFKTSSCLRERWVWLWNHFWLLLVPVEIVVGMRRHVDLVLIISHVHLYAWVCHPSRHRLRIQISRAIICRVVHWKPLITYIFLGLFLTALLEILRSGRLSNVIGDRRIIRWLQNTLGILSQLRLLDLQELAGNPFFS